MHAPRVTIRPTSMTHVPRPAKIAQVVSETTETERIVALSPLRGQSFAYALANGTTGVYEQPGNRRWRVKSKHEVAPPREPASQPRI